MDSVQSKLAALAIFFGLAIVSTNSCRLNPTLFLSVQDIDSDYFFVITATEGLSKLDVVNDVARVRSESKQPLIRFNLPQRNVDIIIIGIQKNVLNKRFPSFDGSSVQELQLIDKSDIPLAPQDVIYAEIVDLVRVFQPIQASSKIEEASDALLATIGQKFALAVPQNADRCRNESQERLSHILPSNKENDCGLPDYIYVQGLDSSRFVAATKRIMHLYDISGTRTCADFSVTTSSNSLSFPDAKFIAVSTTQLPDSQEPHFLAAAVAEEFASEEDKRQVIPSRFRLQTLTISPNGFNSETETYYVDAEKIKTIVTDRCPRAQATGNPRIVEVTIDHTNRVSLAMSNGTIAYLDYNAEDFNYAVICDFSQYAVDWLLEVSHINSRPTDAMNYFIGTDNKEGFAYSLTIPSDSSDETQYYVDPGQQLAIRASYYDEHLDPPRFIAVGEGQFSTEASVKDRALILEQSLSRDTLVPIVTQFPRRIENCMTNGYLTKILKIEGNEKAYFLLPKCNGIVRMRREDRCSMLLKSPDFQETFVSDGRNFRDIALVNDVLVAVGDDGLVATISLQDIDNFY
ncbi:MAG: hypothetical protein VYC39_05045 [Myxococcota bacterium]|nr:hypothetical protein [Myxococcota bacterium]